MLDCSSWEAWRNNMPGSDALDLHVAGRCSFQGSSTDLELAVGNQGINPDPAVLRLRLTARWTETSDARMGTREVTWQGRADRATRVVVYGEAGATIDVRMLG